jgi:hypothetical protein
MANEINIILTTGLIVSAEFYQGGALALTVNLTERGTSGHYFNSTNISGLASGNYFVDFKSTGLSVGSGYLYWDGTKEVLNKLDADISTRSTQASVNSIPTNPLLTSDSRLSSLTTIELIRKLITNTSKIDELTNRLIVYDDDGTTPILQFSTKDANGVDSTEQIFEIRKI